MHHHDRRVMTDGRYNGWLLKRLVFIADGCYNGWLLQRMAVVTDGGYN
jgi:hypothetical protein